MHSSTIKSKAASVEFKQVSKVYGGSVKAVDDVSLSVKAGELVTLLGPSGCGKTTTLRMIAGLEMATSGSILIGDADVTRLPATDRDVSMVFQSYALFPHMTVFENVSYGLRVSRMKKAEVRDRAMAGLELVGLAGYGERLPSELSGGQQQRVAVARALVLEPQVLLFDEPLSNLDAKLRRQVREEIRELQTSLGLTVVYVTHDQEEALAVSDRIIVMRNASIAQTGTPRQLYEEPADSFVADFIGEANLVDVNIESIDAADSGLALLHLEGVELRLPSRGLAPGAARLAVRPNRIELLEGQVADGLVAQVVKSTYVGNHMEYVIRLAHGEWFATSDDVDRTHPVGSTVMIRFRSCGPVLLAA
ncbi:ABC transporter ATP-binding protein [Granulosicoccus antarcticus]|uniref:Spermidine/putrescine import ATP-binding protein PotA n=1 Tax=Granulosicoccus antarcticus IMCC3135 TaxID=1192854 RepID=A0A2Z2NI73_9GAMM|nr:ABC transporter ATP-binding protein [Granulosicoccus antarcticus]ASJ71026.1 Spermidine/putrescine import ATP-binding protein PotA [Granulosicoccus antarcticus IMCC3135]